MPITAETATAKAAASRVGWMATSNRDRMSCPDPSVPSRYVPLGFWRMLTALAAFGSCGARTLANMPTSTKMTRNASEATPVGFFMPTSLKVSLRPLPGSPPIHCSTSGLIESTLTAPTMTNVKSDRSEKRSR